MIIKAVGLKQIECFPNAFQAFVHTSYTTVPLLKSISHPSKSKVVRTNSNFYSIVSQNSYSRLPHFSRNYCSNFITIV